LASIQPEVGEFEPHSALFGGTDGLVVVRRIVADAPEFLRPKGFLLIEIGFGQATSVREMFDDSVWSDVWFIRDLQGIERIVTAKLGD
jgi:release factor glutamine methyltransferase